MTTRYIKTKNCSVDELHLTTCGLRGKWVGTPESPEKMFILENVIFGDLSFPSVILFNESLKALCLSSKMVSLHLLYLLSVWTY